MKQASRSRPERSREKTSASLAWVPFTNRREIAEREVPALAEVPDGLQAGAVAPRGQACEHPSDGRFGEQVGRGEELVGGECDLTTGDRAHARALHRHLSPAQGDVAALVTVTIG